MEYPEVYDKIENYCFKHNSEIKFVNLSENSETKFLCYLCLNDKNIEISKIVHVSDFQNFLKDQPIEKFIQIHLPNSSNVFYNSISEIDEYNTISEENCDNYEKWNDKFSKIFNETVLKVLSSAKTEEINEMNSKYSELINILEEIKSNKVFSLSSLEKFFKLKDILNQQIGDYNSSLEKNKNEMESSRQYLQDILSSLRNIGFSIDQVFKESIEFIERKNIENALGEDINDDIIFDNIPCIKEDSKLFSKGELSCDNIIKSNSGNLISFGFSESANLFVHGFYRKVKKRKFHLINLEFLKLPNFTQVSTFKNVADISSSNNLIIKLRHKTRSVYTMSDQEEFIQILTFNDLYDTMLTKKRIEVESGVIGIDFYKEETWVFNWKNPITFFSSKTLKNKDCLYEIGKTFCYQKIFKKIFLAGGECKIFYINASSKNIESLDVPDGVENLNYNFQSKILITSNLNCIQIYEFDGIKMESIKHQNSIKVSSQIYSIIYISKLVLFTTGSNGINVIEENDKKHKRRIIRKTNKCREFIFLSSTSHLFIKDAVGQIVCLKL